MFTFFSSIKLPRSKKQKSKRLFRRSLRIVFEIHTHKNKKVWMETGFKDHSQCLKRIQEICGEIEAHVHKSQEGYWYKAKQLKAGCLRCIAGIQKTI